MKTLILFFILPIFFLNGNNKFINDNSEKRMYLRAFNKIYESLVSEAKIKTRSDILISDKYAPFQMKQLLNTSSLFEGNKLSNAIDSISKSSEILINNCICKSSDSLFSKIKNLVKSKQYVVFFQKFVKGTCRVLHSLLMKIIHLNNILTIIMALIIFIQLNLTKKIICKTLALLRFLAIEE